MSVHYCRLVLLSVGKQKSPRLKHWGSSCFNQFNTAGSSPNQLTFRPCFYNYWLELKVKLNVLEGFPHCLYYLLLVEGRIPWRNAPVELICKKIIEVWRFIIYDFNYLSSDHSLIKMAPPPQIPLCLREYVRSVCSVWRWVRGAASQQRSTMARICSALLVVCYLVPHTASDCGLQTRLGWEINVHTQ